MYWRHIPFTIDHPFDVNSHNTWHPYIWYVPCIILMYILFYIGFGLFKKDSIGILVVAVGILGYILFCIRFKYGTWWFNTPHMFLVGILLAKYEDRFFESCKKLYVLRLIGTILLCIVFWFLGDNAGGIYLMVFHHPYDFVYGYRCDLVAAIFQFIYTLSFMSLYYLISMKLKIGNKVLSFLGKFTLELYLVHGIFIHMFGYKMINDGVKPVYYIENVSLFVLVVLALSIPVSYVLSLLDKKVGKALKPKVN
jgi:fucose 4-O-acetylase-like acetyltransferase